MTIQRFLIVLFTLLILPLHGQFERDTATENRLSRIIYKSRKPETKTKALIDLGTMYFQYDISKADSIARILRPIIEDLNGITQFKAMVFVGKMLEQTGDYNSYFNLVQRFKFFQDEALDKEDAFQKNLHLGFLYSSFLDETKADKALEKAMKYARDLRSFSSITKTYCYMAYNKMLSNQKDMAISFTDEAIQTARRSGFKEDLCMAFNYQAQIYDFFGQLELAVAKNLVAFQLATSNSNWLLMAQYAREIGQKQLLINNLKDAEFYFSRSLEFAQQINDIRQSALALANRAEVSRKRGRFPEALKLNEDALKYLEKVEDQNGLGEVHNNMGLVYKDLNAYPLAVNQFNKALVFYENSVNREKIADVYHNVATIFRKQKRFSKALNYLEKSAEIQQYFGSRSKIYFTYREMAEIYKDLGNKDKALNYMELYLKFADENSTVQASKKIAELSELYRSEQRDRLIAMQADSLDKQERERELTEAKLENASLRNNFQMYVILGCLIIIALAIMIGISRYKQVSIRQKQKEAEMSQTLLRTQMNPHFIFNAMSVIQSYIYENDVKNSSKFLVNFSRLMRLILENSPKEFISLETEMEILQKYLETQKLRFEERFEFELTCDDSLIFDKALIPPMITQPFIENAIEHGQLHTVENGKITVAFSRKDNMLNIEIMDNGIGRKGAEKSKKSKDHKSMALSITQKRIENLNFKYKAEGNLEIDDLDKASETGTKVLISLPYKTDTSEYTKNEQVA